MEKPEREAVVAHELTHLLVVRRFGSARFRGLGWTPVWNEGLAVENGSQFLLHVHRYPDGHIPSPNRFLGRLTARDAKWVLQGQGDPRGNERVRWKMRYPTGFLLMEYLRRGDPLVTRKLGSMLAAMAQHGTGLDEAFHLPSDCARRWCA